MRVGAYQFDVRRGDVAHNLAEAVRGVEQAARTGVALVVLPEMWPTSFPASAEDAPGLVAPATDAVAALAARAAELGVVACGTAFAPSPVDGERPRNRLHVLAGGADLLGQDKLHLFTPTGEGLAFSAGDDPPRVVDCAGLKVGGVVCYDLRFAPLVERLAAEGVELLVCPAQWPRPRLAHWRALLAGRAVEAQCFVVGANRVGEEPLGKRGSLVFPGTSAVVSPGGEVLSSCGPERGLVAADVDPGEVAAMRRRVPVRRDRRDALYPRWSGQAPPGTVR